jgi:hypothetical protein
MERGTAPYGFNTCQELRQNGVFLAENRPKVPENGLKYTRFAGFQGE